MEENSGVVLREGNSKLGFVFFRLGLVLVVMFCEGFNGSIFRSFGNSFDVSFYLECYIKLMVSFEGSFLFFWDGCVNMEVGYLY